MSKSSKITVIKSKTSIPSFTKNLLPHALDNNESMEIIGGVAPTICGGYTEAPCAWFTSCNSIYSSGPTGCNDGYTYTDWCWRA